MLHIPCFQCCIKFHVIVPITRANRLQTCDDIAEQPLPANDNSTTLLALATSNLTQCFYLKLFCFRYIFLTFPNHRPFARLHISPLGPTLIHTKGQISHAHICVCVYFPCGAVFQKAYSVSVLSCKFARQTI